MITEIVIGDEHKGTMIGDDHRDCNWRWTQTDWLMMITEIVSWDDSIEFEMIMKIVICDDRRGCAAQNEIRLVTGWRGMEDQDKEDCDQRM